MDTIVLIPMENLAVAADCLKTLAHPVRLRMVQMLLRNRYTVGELAEACNIQSHQASEHLRLMQHCQLLSRERDGRNMYYRVADSHLERIMQCIESRFNNTKCE